MSRIFAIRWPFNVVVLLDAILVRGWFLEKLVLTDSGESD